MGRFLCLMVLVCSVVPAGQVWGGVVQSLYVPGTSPTGVTSQPLVAGQTYTLEVTGTWNKWSGPNAEADAEWVRVPDGSWQEDFGQGQPSTPPYPNSWADLLVNGQAVNWQGTTDGVTFAEHVYSPSHRYCHEFVSDGSPVTFRLNEVYEGGYNWYSDNSGGVNVDIVAESALYAVCVGSDHWKGLETWQNGKADANGIASKLEAFESCEETTTLYFDYTETEGNSEGLVFSALAALEDTIADNDILVFFYSGHGSGGEGLDETLAMNRHREGDCSSVNDERSITDDELTDWFTSDVELVDRRMRRDIWANVNKLFILDSCNSGGFANGIDADGAGGVRSDMDLEGLNKAAILAACEEIQNTGTNFWGRGEFTLAVERALAISEGYAAADAERDGLSFQDLKDFLQQEWEKLVAASPRGYDGYIKRDPAGDDLVLEHFLPTYFAWSSDDFDMNLKASAIPEPTTVALVALAMTGLGSYVRKRRRS